MGLNWISSNENCRYSRYSLTSFSEDDEERRYSCASKNSDIDSGIDALLSLDAWCTKEWEPPEHSWKGKRFTESGLDKRVES